MDTKGKRCVVPAISNVQKLSATQKRLHWVPPMQGSYKINVDAAFNQLSGDAAVGVVILDWKGSLILTVWRVLSHCRDAEEAEVVACLEGIHLAMTWPEILMILESVAKRWSPSSTPRAMTILCCGKFWRRCTTLAGSCVSRRW